MQRESSWDLVQNWKWQRNLQRCLWRLFGSAGIWETFGTPKTALFQRSHFLKPDSLVDKLWTNRQKLPGCLLGALSFPPRLHERCFFELQKESDDEVEGSTDWVILGGGKRRAQQEICLMSVLEDEPFPKTPWFQTNWCYFSCYMESVAEAESNCKSSRLFSSICHFHLCFILFYAPLVKNTSYFSPWGTCFSRV